jgi:hypothetical protein
MPRIRVTLVCQRAPTTPHAARGPRHGLLATLPAELVQHEAFTTKRAAEQTVGRYIENFYNVSGFTRTSTTSACTDSH